MAQRRKRRSPRKASGTNRTDELYASITARIIADLEKGVATWHKPWNASGTAEMPLRANGQPYKGVNVLLLWSEAMDKGYTGRHWFTYKQAAEVGGQVRKGEKASYVFLAKPVTMREQDDNGEDVERKIHIRRAYPVFNADQVDDLPDKFRQSVPAINPDARDQAAADWFAKIGANVRHGGGRAFYRPGADFIQMPEFGAFESAEAYYATLAHEHVHWTGAGNRLKRQFGGRGTDDYAREELVAELGAAFVCALLGLSAEPRADHSAYIGSWLRVLKGDPKAVVQAASLAQAAADYLQAQAESQAVALAA